MITRYCAFCGKEIQVSIPYNAKYVRYQNKWYCADCFTTITTPRVLSHGWFDKTKDYVVREVSKDDIDKLFKKHYGIDFIPSYIYVKLEAIYKGEYKGLAQPIPPHELLDILRRKMDYLDSNALRKGLTGIPRINYDLAVAMGSYKSYKEWQASVLAEQEEAKRQAEDRQGYSYKLKGYSVQPEPDQDNNFIDLDEDE